MISVCMATYNGGEYVYTQLNSILKQLGRNDELIISDDGSTDNTINIIEKYNDPRIKLIRHDRGWLDPKTTLLSRVKKNFEEAIRLATGEFIFLSDQDDIWLPGRVEECLAEFKNGFDLIVCDCIVTDKNKILFSSYYEIIKPSSNILRTLYKSSFHGCCLAFSRKMNHYILPMPNENIGHDIWIGLQCIINGKVKFIDKQLVNYRRHDDTVTQCGFKSTNKLKDKIIYRLAILTALCKRKYISCLK